VLADEHAHMVTDCGARLLVADGALLEQRQSGRGAARSRRQWPCDLARPLGPGCAPSRASRPKARWSRPHARHRISRRSSTRAAPRASPRGVMLSHQAWIRDCGLRSQILRYGDGKSRSIWLPLLTGRVSCCCPPSRGRDGASVLQIRAFTRARAAFAGNGVTNGFSCIDDPMLLDSTSSGRADAPSLRSLYTPGRRSIPTRCAPRCAVRPGADPIVRASGDTDVPDGARSSGACPDRERRNAQSHAVRGAASRRRRGQIVDDDDRDLAAAKLARSLRAGPHMMAGYWNRPTPRPTPCATDGCIPATSVASTTRGTCTLSIARRT
jgi:hypothetical protein